MLQRRRWTDLSTQLEISHDDRNLRTWDDDDDEDNEEESKQVVVVIFPDRLSTDTHTYKTNNQWAFTL